VQRGADRMNLGQAIDAEWVQGGACGRSVRYLQSGLGLQMLVDEALGTRPRPAAPAFAKLVLLPAGTTYGTDLQAARTHVIEDDPEPHPLLLRAQPIAEHIRKVMSRISEPATTVEIAFHAKMKTRQVGQYLWRAGEEVVVFGLTGPRRYTLSDTGRALVAEAEARK